MKWVVDALENLRKKRPLVQNITNFVVMNTTANALLAVGASPVMAHAVDELEDMLKLADALVVNIGTLDEHWIRSMEEAVRVAASMGKPVVLDPVGAGATRLRTKTALRLLEAGRISVLRGNFGEVSALLGGHGVTRGVDSTVYDGERARELAERASREFGTAVAVTGPVDYVSDSRETYAVENGHPMLGRVTGTGCIATALIGAFLAVETPLKAAVGALAVFGIAAEKAFEEAPYPGSFHTKLYDWLYKIDSSILERYVRVRRL
uniref:Hydroxyethylthiazole kinase n=1 Tax=Fervidicoccus fontis TaxID=683846 RepID=A0A7J3ZLR4_9CREN